MLTSISTIVALMFTCVLMNILLINVLKSKKLTQTHNIFIFMCIFMLFWLLELIMQAVYSKSAGIEPIYFDYFVYINACYLPVLFLLLSIAFSNTKVKFTRRILSLFILPTISLLVLWTNKWHHLFYITYSTNFQDTVYGPYFYIHTVYSYLLIIIGVVGLIKYSTKNSGFFSRQSILISLGAIIPVVINILGTYGIIKMSIYITPISFAIAIIFFAIAILKFDFLKAAPIALQRIVDRISDSYIVVDENNVVTDFNATFLELFGVKAQDLRNKSLEELFKKFNKVYGIKEDLILRFSRKSKRNKRYYCFRRTSSIN